MKRANLAFILFLFSCPFYANVNVDFLSDLAGHFIKDEARTKFCRKGDFFSMVKSVRSLNGADCKTEMGASIAYMLCGTFNEGSDSFSSSQCAKEAKNFKVSNADEGRVGLVRLLNNKVIEPIAICDFLQKTTDFSSKCVEIYNNASGYQHIKRADEEVQKRKEQAEKDAFAKAKDEKAATKTREEIAIKAEQEAQVKKIEQVKQQTKDALKPEVEKIVQVEKEADQILAELDAIKGSLNSFNLLWEKSNTVAFDLAKLMQRAQKAEQRAFMASLKSYVNDYQMELLLPNKWTPLYPHAKVILDEHINTAAKTKEKAESASRLAKDIQETIKDKARRLLSLNGITDDDIKRRMKITARDPFEGIGDEIDKWEALKKDVSANPQEAEYVLRALGYKKSLSSNDEL